jgi:hypothetical protein
MTAALVLAIAFLQVPGGLQPGAGIVTGSIQLEIGGPAANVRVAAMAVDDPSSLVSVAETDSSGRYRLSNIPKGKYYIVAGRLDNLTYYPSGHAPAGATQVTVEAAKITPLGSFSVPGNSQRPAPKILTASQAPEERNAFDRIKSERNMEAKEKLMLAFEKTYPKSNRLAEVEIELSRTFASQSDFATANQHALKAVDAVSTMKSKIAQGGYDNSFKDWIRSLDDSARSNLAWTKSMVAWQQEQLQRALLRRR